MMNDGHPTFDELLDYQEDLAEDKIQDHVSGCERCHTILDGIKTLGGREQYLRYSHEAHRRVSARVLPTKRGTGLGKWYAIAAAIALLVLAGIFFQDLSAPDLDGQIAQHLEEPYPVAFVTRDGNYNNWQEFESAYLQGEYLEGERILSDMSPGHARDFYLALTKIYQAPPKTEDAIAILKQLAEEDGRFQQQSRWFLSLAYFQQGNMEAGRLILNRITEDANHFRYQEAIDMVGDL